MMEHESQAGESGADDWQSEHERTVAEIERSRTPSPESDATVDEGRRPSSGEDLAADRTPGDEGQPAGDPPGSG